MRTTTEMIADRIHDKVEAGMPQERRLSAGTLKPLAALIDHLGLAPHFLGDAVLHGADPVIRSPHRLGEASGMAQLLIGVAGATIWHARTGQKTDIGIDIIDALHYLHPTHFVEQQGRPMNVGAEFVDVNGMFLCRDNRYLMIEAGPPYMKLLKGYLNFFDCGYNKDSIAREIAKWDSADLETALSKAGLPACRAFTREEWIAHPQGAALSHTIPLKSSFQLVTELVVAHDRSSREICHCTIA